MTQGRVLQICVAPERRGPMVSVDKVMATQGHGLEGDRYSRGEGSYNQGAAGKRQVTLMHARAFARQKVYTFQDSRRGILIGGEIELTWLLAKGHEFDVGEARLNPIGYCDPCHVPTKCAGKSRKESFRELFWESGGIIAEVVRGGIIQVGCCVIAPDKGYGNDW